MRLVVCFFFQLQVQYNSQNTDVTFLSGVKKADVNKHPISTKLAKTKTRLKHSPNLGPRQITVPTCKAILELSAGRESAKQIDRKHLIYCSPCYEYEQINQVKLTGLEEDCTLSIKIYFIERLISITSPPCSKTVSSTTSLNISIDRQNPKIQSLLPISSP